MWYVTLLCDYKGIIFGEIMKGFSRNIDSVNRVGSSQGYYSYYFKC